MRFVRWAICLWKEHDDECTMWNGIFYFRCRRCGDEDVW